MTEQEQRIAIAEACDRNGWWCPQCKKLVSEYSLGYQNRHANCTESAQQAPDYLHDLNAMHEAWGILNRRQRVDFSQHLRNIVVYGGFSGYSEDIRALSENATAAQRAEAFLRTLGKWKD